MSIFSWNLSQNKWELSMNPSLSQYYAGSSSVETSLWIYWLWLSMSTQDLALGLRMSPRVYKGLKRFSPQNISRSMHIRIERTLFTYLIIANLFGDKFHEKLDILNKRLLTSDHRDGHFLSHTHSDTTNSFKASKVVFWDIDLKLSRVDVLSCEESNASICE